MIFKKQHIIFALIVVLATLGFALQQQRQKASLSPTLDAWGKSIIVSDPSEKVMGSADCGDPEFSHARQEIAKREVRRLTFTGGLRLYRTANPLLWADAQFRALNLNQKAICDVGGVYPLRATGDYLFWATSCGGSIENVPCDESRKRIEEEYAAKYGQPVDFTWIKSVPDEPTKTDSLVLLTYYRSALDTQELLGTKENIQPGFYRNISGQFEFLATDKSAFITGRKGFIDQPSINWNAISSNSGSKFAQTKITSGGDSTAFDQSDIVEVRSSTGKLINSVSTMKYGSEWRNIEPIAFTTDEQSIILRLWGLRGGDFTDRQAVIVQSLKSTEYSFISESPDPVDPNEKTKKVVATVLTDARPEGDKLFFSRIQYDNWIETVTTLLYYDLRTMRITEIVSDIPGRVVPIWSPLGTFGISQSESGLQQIDVTQKTIKDVTQPEGSCSIEGVSNDGRYFASSCSEGAVTRIQATDLNEIRTWDLLRSPDSKGTRIRFVTFLDM